MNYITLREELVDPDAAQRALAAAEPLDRIVLLRLLGRPAEAIAEAKMLAGAVDADDEWRLLIASADAYRWLDEYSAARIMLEQAWHRAGSRQLKAETLHRMGLRWFDYGDIVTAGAFFEAARTLGATDSAFALTRIRDVLAFDVILLAGGAGSRMGGPDKPLRTVNQWPLVDHVLLACAGATNRIVVGPELPMRFAEPTYCREEPPGAGPVAALAAGLAHVTQPIVFVLAADLPFIAQGLELLRNVLIIESNDAGAFVDLSGRTNYLAAIWRTDALRAAVAAIAEPSGAPMKRVYENVSMARIPDFDDNAADCDTAEDLADAERRFTDLTAEQRAAAPLAWLARQPSPPPGDPS